MIVVAFKAEICYSKVKTKPSGWKPVGSSWRLEAA